MSRVLLIGDSIANDPGFQASLRKALSHVELIDATHISARILDFLPGAKYDVQKTIAAQGPFDGVLQLLGTNDASIGRSVDTMTMDDVSLSHAVNDVAPQTTYVLSTIPLSHAAAQTIGDYDASLLTLQGKTPSYVSIVDGAELFNAALAAAKTTAELNSFFQADGVHLSRMGMDLYARGVLKNAFGVDTTVVVSTSPDSGSHPWTRDAFGRIVLADGSIPRLSGTNFSMFQHNVFEQWGSLFHAEASTHGLSIHMLDAICYAESMGNPNALRHEPSGATGVGLFQITETSLKAGHTDAELMDPGLNAQIGAGFLGQIVNRAGDDPLVDASIYNAGPGKPDAAGHWTAKLLLSDPVFGLYAAPGYLARVTAAYNTSIDLSLASQPLQAMTVKQSNSGAVYVVAGIAAVGLGAFLLR